jgi:hypothetical protein
VKPAPAGSKLYSPPRLALLDRQISDKELRHGDLLDILLSLRSQNSWYNMVETLQKISSVFPGERTLEVGQLESMALNRVGLSLEAEKVLQGLLARYGANSETLGILGRVYKDRFAHNTDTAESTQWLLRAINTYAKGAECNPGEIYPLINLLTLMACGGNRFPGHGFPYLTRLLHDRYQSGRTAYFDLATGLEVSIILGCWDIAREFLNLTLSVSGEAWELETTR